MLRVEMLPARQGDALWIEWGDPARPHRMIVDGGVSATWKVLRDRIAALPQDDRHFELLVVSHVDGDHILGAVPLLADERLGATFADVWFNGWRHLPDALEPMGPVDGEELTWLLKDRPWNTAFGGDAVVVPDTGTLPARTLEGELRLTVVSPGREQLERLAPVWSEEVRRAGLEPGQGRAPTPTSRSGLEALGAAIPDVEALATSRFDADGAEANGSSIALLVEHDGRSALLCADGFPDVILAGVKRLLDERGGGSLALSALKLPHHGSRNNVNLALLERLACREFLFSSDGTRTKHPHPEAVARVLHTFDAPHLWFNYRTGWNDVWDRARVRRELGHTATYGEAGIAVTLEPPA